MAFEQAQTSGAPAIVALLATTVGIFLKSTKRY